MAESVTNITMHIDPAEVKAVKDTLERQRATVVALEQQCFLADRIVACLLMTPVSGTPSQALEWAQQLAAQYVAEYDEDGRRGEDLVETEMQWRRLGDLPEPPDYLTVYRNVRNGYAPLEAWPGLSLPDELLEQDEAWEEHKGHFTDGEDAAAAAAERSADA